MTIKPAALFLSASFACGLSAQARLGDGILETLTRYGQPVATAAQPGALTATRTFQVSGLTVTCGYVKGIVEMESYTRTDRAFMPPEVEALLRTNGRHRNWTPSDSFGPGIYHRTDGATATVTDTQITIATPKWAAALAQDKANADKAAAAKAAKAAATQTNTPAGG